MQLSFANIVCKRLYPFYETRRALFVYDGFYGVLYRIKTKCRYKVAASLITLDSFGYNYVPNVVYWRNRYIFKLKYLKNFLSL